jgi:hypothetical protein
MKTRYILIGQIALSVLISTLFSCSDDGFVENSNGQLKKIKNGGYIVEEISYNQNSRVLEVKSTMFYRKFHYDTDLKLIKEEVAISPDSYSSSSSSISTHEFVDPKKTGISMYSLFEYDSIGRLSRKLNYIPKSGSDEFRSKTTLEYNDNNLITKELLYNNNGDVTQFRTYLYDSNGNVIEEDYYTYLFITPGTGPEHMSKITYEYDSFNNPYKIFELSGAPGIYTNKNNIIKTKTINYDPSPGIQATSESTTSYEYNLTTGFPTKVVNGEEYIYD